MSDRVEVEYHNRYIIARQKLTRRIDERGISLCRRGSCDRLFLEENSSCNSAVQACKLERGKGTNTNSIAGRLA